MYDAKADVSRNLVIATLAGYLTEEDATAAADLVIAESNKLKPGFICITDLSTFKPVSTVAAEQITRTVKHIAEKGVAVTVRIIGNAITDLQFKRTYREGGATYDVVQVRTMEEAMEYVAERSARMAD